MTLGKVWFATHHRAMSLWKFIVFDDIGTMVHEDGVLGFIGRRYDFDLDDIRSVRVTTIRVAWGIMIPSLLATILLVLCVPLPCYGMLAMAKDLISQVIISTVIGLIIAGLYLYLAIRLPYLWRTPWVCIEHGTSSGGVTYSYFALCTDLGRSVRRQETRQLAEHLRAELEAGRLLRPVERRMPLPKPRGSTEDGIQSSYPDS
jgi:hypothetical protein